MTTTEAFTQRVEVTRPPAARYWSPAQLIAPAVGFVFVAWGLINIGHSGFHPERVFQPHDALAGLHYTPFLASLEVGFGLAMLIGGALLRAARTRVRTLNGLAVGLGMVIVTLAGGAALGLGIVILVDAWPTQVHHWLNADHRDAVLFLGAGVASLCAAIASPFVLAPAEGRGLLQPEQTAPPEPEPAPESPEPEPELVAAHDAG
ncbi:MAG TPA: hypothetical protein VLV81_10130 [Acidimicrobiia bacterium]|nr:hypothetical protein [Acidimicrobiia bacterium]